MPSVTLVVTALFACATRAAPNDIGIQQASEVAPVKGTAKVVVRQPGKQDITWQEVLSTGPSSHEQGGLALSLRRHEARADTVCASVALADGTNIAPCVTPGGAPAMVAQSSGDVTVELHFEPG